MKNKVKKFVRDAVISVKSWVVTILPRLVNNKLKLWIYVIIMLVGRDYIINQYCRYVT